MKCGARFRRVARSDLRNRDSSIAEPSSDAHLGNNDITSVQGVQAQIDSSMELVEQPKFICAPN
jgi:hypothetical protein